MDNQIAEKENLEFWDRFCKTDPKFVKPAKIGGRKISSVDAQYKKWMITKAFGMYGKGWGIVANSESFERIHYDDSTCILQYTATAFYVEDEKQYQLPIASSVKEAYMTNGGQGYLKIDDDAVKKVRTDALTKGFTDLGFTADIFLGKFDDYRYVEDLSNEISYKESTEGLMKSVEVIKEGIESGDLQKASEAWFELTEEEMKLLWRAPTKGGHFTTAEIKIIKSSEFRKSHYGENENGE